MLYFKYSSSSNGYSAPILGGIKLVNPMTVESAVGNLQVGADTLTNIRLLLTEWKNPT